MVRPLLVKGIEVNTINGPMRRSIHILVVGDEPLIAQPLVDALAAEGYEIDVAVNGRRALEKIKDRAYDLILSDLLMPVLDGVPLCQELGPRQPGRLPPMPLNPGATVHYGY